MPNATTRFSAEHPIRVFLLDDHELVRRGLANVLGSEPDIRIVCEGATAEQALHRTPALRPDVAVLDVRLPDMDGITVCREIRSTLPDTACLMLTSFDDEDALLDAATHRPPPALPSHPRSRTARRTSRSAQSLSNGHRRPTGHRRERIKAPYGPSAEPGGPCTGRPRPATLIPAVRSALALSR
ncbi:response regulator transcription factor [Streptomyces sp. NPDC046939]|uniref:response regulator n=1 Tax=Streptomyces sp. NPDC046939 TaxID=3155376 RepID=UPI0033FF681F